MEVVYVVNVVIIVGTVYITVALDLDSDKSLSFNHRELDSAVQLQIGPVARCS